MLDMRAFGTQIISLVIGLAVHIQRQAGLVGDHGIAAAGRGPDLAERWGGGEAQRKIAAIGMKDHRIGGSRHDPQKSESEYGKACPLRITLS